MRRKAAEVRKLLCSGAYPLTDVEDIAAPRESHTLSDADLTALPRLLAVSHARLDTWRALPDVRTTLEFDSPADGLKCAPQG